VWLANTNPILGLLRALIVRLIPSLQLAARQTSHVNVKLDILGKMQAHALSAISLNTKQYWGLLVVLIVHQTPSLQMAASQKAPVNVTLGIKE